MSNAGSVNVQIGATFASTFRAAFGSAEKEIGKLGSTVATLDGKLQRVTGFQRMRQTAYDAETAWRQADQELRAMTQHLAGLDTVTDKQSKEFKALERQTEKLRVAMVAARTDTDKMERELRDAGQSTDNLTADQKELERQLTVTTNRMKALAGLANTGVGGALAGVGTQFRSLTTQATIAGAAVGYFFKTNFLDTAAQFEKFQTILETTEGSSEGARKAMNWVSDFAAKTPFELAQVTDAFVKLRAYGLDPTNGLLQTLGDTGAAMGKDVMMAVEAIADAVTGENERLKEFGVKGKKEGDTITYEYTDKSGQMRTAQVEASNRAMIESTLTAIFNEKYAGAMDKLSRTWGGMTSNIGDQWTRFTNMVMESGPFEIMKGHLTDLLATIDKMAADGSLKQYAEQTGQALVKFGEGAWQLGTAIVTTTQWLADMVGGWKNLGIALAVIKLAPLAFSIAKLGWTLGIAANFLVMFATGTATAAAAWKAFGLAIVANPIGIALAALATAGYLLWQNWDEVKGGMVALWATIKDTAIAAFDAIKNSVGAVIDWLAEKTAWIFNTVDKVKNAASSIGGSIGNGWDRAKSLVGIGEGGTAGVGHGAAAVVPVPSAAAGSVSQSSSINAPITINGATDPAETARQVRAELDRREREAAARRRGTMVDSLGY